MKNENRLTKGLVESFYNSCGVGIVVEPKLYQKLEELFGKEWCGKYLIMNKPLK